MKNKFSILLIAATFIIGGCDNRVEIFTKMDTPPIVQFQIGSTNLIGLTDSIKRSDTANYYPLVLSVTAPTSQISDLAYKINGNTGHFTYRGLTITSGKLPTEYQFMNVNYFPDSLGTSDLEFTATNRFGKTSTAHAKIVYFDNLPPTSVLKINRTDNTSAFEYTIDGSSSYDADARFGGYITGYTFSLDNQVINTQRSNIKYIFPSAGDYVITLSVRDNNNSTNTVTQTIKVQ